MQGLRVTLLVGTLLSAGPASAETVFIDVAAGAQRIKSGATVLDARGSDARSPYLPNAVVVDWMKVRDGAGRTGRIASPEEARKYFEARGVSNDRPVLVYGNMDRGWGEEGRIWWMLRYLGHDDVRILNGGINHWTGANQSTSAHPTKRNKRGTFVARPRPKLRASSQEIRALEKKPTQILDTRTQEEFAGATPYWSFRGGHIPGATNIEWKRALSYDGTVPPVGQLARRLRRLGVQFDRPIITYCTGGVRSAFMQAVLTHAGHADVANYDGSWWDWSERTELPIDK